MEDYEYIEEFILAIQDEYPAIEINYDYNEDVEEYYIKHNSSRDRGFDNFVHEKAQEYLLSNGVVNFYIDAEQ